MKCSNISTIVVMMVFGASSISGLSVANKLERRKDFYTTHEEHGHLPGLRNPSPFALLDQVGRMIKGENPMEILQSYNEKADEEKGARFGRASKKTGKYGNQANTKSGGSSDGGHGHGGHGDGGKKDGTTSAGIFGPLGFSDIPILGKF